jgi:hypothetical protein
MAYRTARAEADEIFDYHMQQMALSLRAGLPPVAMAGGDAHDDQGRDFVVQVWTAEGLRVFRVGACRAAAARGAGLFGRAGARQHLPRVLDAVALARDPGGAGHGRAASAWRRRWRCAPWRRWR